MSDWAADFFMAGYRAAEEEYKRLKEALQTIQKEHCECCWIYQGKDCNCQSALACDCLKEINSNG